MSRFIPELSRLASEKLDQPVKIAELKLHLVPAPRVVARGIRVGKDDEATIGELEIVPELLSLLWAPRTIRLVRAETVELKEAALVIPGSLPKREGAQAIEIRRIVLNRVKVHHSAMKLPEFDVEATLDERMAIQAAHLNTRDGALRIALVPERPGLAKVSLEARKWTLPGGAPLAFESLTAQGTLKGEQLDLPAIAGSLYGGGISASARIDWSKPWQVSGKARLIGIDLAPVQQALGRPAQLSGRLTSEVVFSSRAGTADELSGALVLDAPFEVSEGAYRGMDLSQVTQLTTGRLPSGGATRFDELSGKLQVRGKGSRVNDLCVRSKSLVAGGYVEVAPDQKLAGKLDISVAKTKGVVGVPVALSGTSDEPWVSLTTGAMIGAVVGTILLPGIGTGLGASAGNAIEGKAGGCN
jgi:hypothetical protein